MESDPLISFTGVTMPRPEGRKKERLSQCCSKIYLYSAMFDRVARTVLTYSGIKEWDKTFNSKSGTKLNGNNNKVSCARNEMIGPIPCLPRRTWSSKKTKTHIPKGDRGTYHKEYE